MEQSTLVEILGVEKEIRARLEDAREQADRWLEIASQQVEREHRSELARLKVAARRRRAAALRRARDAANAVVQRAEQAAATRAALGDAELQALIRNQLAAVLPEEAR